jgi:hypothetical protein
MASKKARILILCKTYPSPSSKYAETSCVAGVDEAGKLIRLFPVPFRFISDEQQFRKWQWITARIEKAKDDLRPESHKIKVDTIECNGNPLPTDDRWAERRRCLASVPVFSDFAALDAARQSDGVTLGFLRPAKILRLDVTPDEKSDWTDEERKKLVQMQRQANLFEETDATVKTLRKIPYKFHYRYECAGLSGAVEYRHKIVDWEAGALYWNVLRKHGSKWEQPFRDKLERDLPTNDDLMFLMGTIHRFPDKWLIVSLIYPPKQQPESARQGSLL